MARPAWKALLLPAPTPAVKAPNAGLLRVAVPTWIASVSLPPRARATASPARRAVPILRVRHPRTVGKAWSARSTRAVAVQSARQWPMSVRIRRGSLCVWPGD